MDVATPWPGKRAQGFRQGTPEFAEAVERHGNPPPCCACGVGGHTGRDWCFLPVYKRLNTDTVPYRLLSEHAFWICYFCRVGYPLVWEAE